MSFFRKVFGKKEEIQVISKQEVLYPLAEKQCKWYIESKRTKNEEKAKRCGCKECLVLIKSSWNEDLMLEYAAKGNFEAMKFLHDNGCYWDSRTIYEAAKNKHVDCLKYAYDRGCTLHPDICRIAAENGDLVTLKFCYRAGFDLKEEKVAEIAIDKGYLHIFNYTQEKGIRMTANLCSIAAKNGDLTLLQHLRKIGCPWDSETTTNAAKHGHIACLQFAVQHLCDMTWRTTQAAAGGGHLQCLKYLHEQGCGWDNATITSAAENGHLSCLRYAFEHGCDWSEYAIRWATWNKQIACIKFCIDNAFPYDSSTPDAIRILNQKMKTQMSLPEKNLVSNNVYSYRKENPNKLEHSYKMDGKCMVCALRSKSIPLSKIPWKNPNLSKTRIGRQYIWARKTIYQAMERAYLNPQYAWCVRRLKRGFDEMINEPIKS